VVGPEPKGKSAPVRHCRRLSAQVKVVSVEIEANPVTTANYQVLNVPTLILLKFGQEMVRLTGPQSAASILEAISPFFDR
jgi:thioredoxin-like negative regulator of GroEL